MNPVLRVDAQFSLVTEASLFVNHLLALCIRPTQSKAFLQSLSLSPTHLPSPFPMPLASNSFSLPIAITVTLILSLDHFLALTTTLILYLTHSLPLQNAAASFLRILASASDREGPAPQRMACLLGTCLASRLAGDGLHRYLTCPAPMDPRTVDAANMHYMERTPIPHFFNACATASLSHALAAAHRRAAAAKPSSRPLPPHSSSHPLPRPSSSSHDSPSSLEHIHIIDLNIETCFPWVSLALRQLADRPQGVPRSMKVTMVDALPRQLAGDGAQLRRLRAMQAREQLKVQAVVVGVERFECELVTCCFEELREKLEGVRVSERRAEMMRKEVEEGMLKAKRADACWAAGGGVAATAGEADVSVAQCCATNQHDGHGHGHAHGCNGGRRGAIATECRENERSSLVDVLFVCNMMRLVDYPQCGVNQDSPRDTVLSVSDE